MRRGPVPALALAALGALSMMLAACGASEEQTPTQSPSPTPTPTTTATATSTQSAGDIREVDFTDPAVIGPVIDHFGGGEVEPRRVEYVDMTGDGEDDAVVFVESGGTQGDLGACLVALERGAPAVLGFVDAGGRVELRFPEAGGGVLVALEGVYEPGDPGCCPSKLRERTYRWTGDAFELTSDQTVDNPDVG